MAIFALHQVNHHSPMSRIHHIAQLNKVFGSPQGYRIGKFRDIAVDRVVAAQKVDILTST